MIWIASEDFVGNRTGLYGNDGFPKTDGGVASLLKEEGFDPEKIGRIHMPIGLSIGALTPAEIGNFHYGRNLFR